VLEFDAPTAEQVGKLIAANLGAMTITKPSWKKIVESARGLSQSEIVRATDDAVKTAILDERNHLSVEDLLERLHERHAMRSAFSESKGA
jgi:AAA+ superfamily predicted ATPase